MILEPPPLLAFSKNLILMNPSLDPACTGRGHTLAEAPSIVRGVNPWGCQRLPPGSAVGRRLASADSLQIDARFRLAFILSADEALRDLGTFAFVASYLLSAGRRHSSAFAELIRFIERL